MREKRERKRESEKKQTEFINRTKKIDKLSSLIKTPPSPSSLAGSAKMKARARRRMCRPLSVWLAMA